MNPAHKLLAFGAACAVCCALPSAGALLAMVGLAGVSGAALGWVAGLATTAVALGTYFLWRRARKAACAPVAADGSCGCAAGGTTSSCSTG